MNIVDLSDKHASLVADESYTFVLGDDAYKNVIADLKNFPICFLDEPIIVNDDPKQSGYYEENYPCKYAFMYPSKFEWTPKQHQPWIDKAMADAREFVLRLKADSVNVDRVLNVKRVAFKNWGDVNSSGCFLFVNIIKRNTDGVCLT